MISGRNRPSGLKSPVARRLADFASVEAGAVVDLYGPFPLEAYARKIHASLLDELSVFDKVPRKHEKIQQELIASINQHTDLVLQKAKTAFVTAMATDVLYEVKDSPDEETGEAFAFDSSQMPFIRYHAEALTSLQLIREQPLKVQVSLMSYLNAFDVTSSAKVGLADAIQAKEAKKKIETFRSRKTRPQISAAVLDEADSFYGSMDFGSTHADSLPIRMDSAFPSSVLKEVAESLWNFGSDLLPPNGLTLRGNPRERLKARNAWMLYQSCGTALKILGGWVRAIAHVPNERFCDLCYRHAATKKRCAEHATSSHETREGRLGKKIKPYYLARADSLKRQTSIRRCLASQIVQFNYLEENTILDAAVLSLGLKPELQGRAKTLASQLQLLRHLLNESMQKLVQSNFLKILSIATEIYELPIGNSMDSERQRQREVARANELLSMKGFFRCWFIGPRSKEGESGPPRLAFDTRHPLLVDDEVDPATLALQLLHQRAWHEAEQAFHLENLPEGQQVNNLVHDGFTLKEIAVKLHYSYSGLRAMYKKWKTGVPRQRNRHRPD